MTHGRAAIRGARRRVRRRRAARRLVATRRRPAAARPGSIRGRVELRRTRRTDAAPAGRVRSRRAGAARPARSAALGRLPRVGAARRVRNQRRRPRRDGSAQRDVRAARARDHDRHDRRLSEQRPRSTTTCSRSRRPAVRSRPLRGRAGRSRSASISPGIVRVFCDIHSHMNAFILVFSHPFFAMTDADGRYRIDNVPPGTYNVVAWNEGMSSEPQAGHGPRRRRRRARLHAAMTTRSRRCAAGSSWRARCSPCCRSASRSTSSTCA